MKASLFLLAKVGVKHSSCFTLKKMCGNGMPLPIPFLGKKKRIKQGGEKEEAPSQRENLVISSHK